MNDSWPVAKRIVVIGATGSGKSTLAAELAQFIGAPHGELDELYHGPRWTASRRDVFRDAVSVAIACEPWVIDGNYIDTIQDVVWPRADLIVWLDQPLAVALTRLGWRSLRRM